MTKKVGCVIAYKKNHTNYGTSLVGYALVKKLQQLGYDVEIINYVKRLSFSEKVAIAINQFRVQGAKMFLKRFESRPTCQAYIDGIKTRTKSVEAYKQKKLIPLFHDYVGYKALAEGSLNYDAVVVGSDQVWLPHGLKTKFFNLLFVNDAVRKIAYASSFGVSEIPSFQKKETAHYLNRFYRVSVREQKGKEIVDALSKNKATVVADPTLLLNADDWTKEAKNTNVDTFEPYIFCYFLGTNPDARKAANELKAKTGLKIITLRHMDEFVESDEQFGDEAPYAVNPNDFVKYIKDAEYVLTDSFHCSAFSIQFHKRFMTFYRFAIASKGGRNSRIDSLFNMLGIPREHIYQGDVLKVDNPIEWNVVEDNLQKVRNNSIGFIQEALK